jgi:hypothetical protein
MRRWLLVGTAVFVLALGAAGAGGVTLSPETAVVGLSQFAPAACASAKLAEGRAAFTDDNDDQARLAGDRRVGQTFREDLVILARNVVLLAVTSLVFGLGAIGAKALWMLDDTQSSSHGWPPRWFDQ